MENELIANDINNNNNNKLFCSTENFPDFCALESTVISDDLSDFENNNNNNRNNQLSEIESDVINEPLQIEVYKKNQVRFCEFFYRISEYAPL
jgi:hypothetical protein